MTVERLFSANAVQRVIRLGAGSCPPLCRSECFPRSPLSARIGSLRRSRRKQQNRKRDRQKQRLTGFSCLFPGSCSCFLSPSCAFCSPGTAPRRSRVPYGLDLWSGAGRNTARSRLARTSPRGSMLRRPVPSVDAIGHKVESSPPCGLCISDRRVRRMSCAGVPSAFLRGLHEELPLPSFFECPQGVCFDTISLNVDGRPSPLFLETLEECLHRTVPAAWSSSCQRHRSGNCLPLA